MAGSIAPFPPRYPKTMEEFRTAWPKLILLIEQLLERSGGMSGDFHYQSGFNDSQLYQLDEIRADIDALQSEVQRSSSHEVVDDVVAALRNVNFLQIGGEVTLERPTGGNTGGFDHFIQSNFEDVNLSILSNGASFARLRLGPYGSSDTADIELDNALDKLTISSNNNGGILVTAEESIILEAVEDVQLESTGGNNDVRVMNDRLRISLSHTPASASATGRTGQFAWDSSFFYICIATDTWQRVAHATW